MAAIGLGGDKVVRGRRWAGAAPDAGRAAGDVLEVERVGGAHAAAREFSPDAFVAMDALAAVVANRMEFVAHPSNFGSRPGLGRPYSAAHGRESLLPDAGTPQPRR